jgi:hypothetical protein
VNDYDTGWDEQQKLIPDNGSSGEGFGEDVDLDGALALIGANRANVSSNNNQGAAYLFEEGYEPPEPTGFVYLPLVVRP